MNEILTDDGNGFPEFNRDKETGITFMSLPIYENTIVQCGNLGISDMTGKVHFLPFSPPCAATLRNALYTLANHVENPASILMNPDDYVEYRASLSVGDARDPGPSWTPYDGPEERNDNS